MLSRKTTSLPPHLCISYLSTWCLHVICKACCSSFGSLALNNARCVLVRATWTPNSYTSSLKQWHLQKMACAHYTSRTRGPWGTLVGKGEVCGAEHIKLTSPQGSHGPCAHGYKTTDAGYKWWSLESALYLMSCVTSDKFLQLIDS